MSTARALALVLVVAGLAPLAAQGDATFASGRYTRAGISVTLPPEWVYQQTRASAAPTDAIAQWLMQPVSAYPASLYVWTSTDGVPDIEAAIAQAIDNKEGERRRAGFQQWRARPQSVRRLTIGGHPALMAVADWRRGDGEARVEYLAWVFTPSRRLLVYSNSGPAQEPEFQAMFERVALSATLP